MSKHNSPIAEIFGTVVAITDHDKFILQTGNNQIHIEVEDHLTLNLTSGQKVTIKGRYDDDEFKAISIIREDGTQVGQKNYLDDIPQADHHNGFDDHHNGFDHSEHNGLNSDDNLFGIGSERQQQVSDNSIIDSLFNSTVYRFQNRHIQGTFLFAEETESDDIRHDYSEIFEEEGMAFRVSKNPGDNLEVIYRMANKDIPGTYLYVGEEEKQNITQNYHNFENEGIAFYVLGSNANQGQDVYRFQSVDNPGTYIFVLEQEKNNILANYSSLFTLEGVAFEVG